MVQMASWSPRSQVELELQVADVGFGCALADPQPIGDVAVSAAVCDQRGLRARVESSRPSRSSCESRPLLVALALARMRWHPRGPSHRLRPTPGHRPKPGVGPAPASRSSPSPDVHLDRATDSRVDPSLQLRSCVRRGQTGLGRRPIRQRSTARAAAHGDHRWTPGARVPHRAAGLQRGANRSHRTAIPATSSSAGAPPVGPVRPLVSSLGRHGPGRAWPAVRTAAEEEVAGIAVRWDRFAPRCNPAAR